MVACDGNCRTLIASADNYIVFFLAGLFSYHGATLFLDDRRVLNFTRNLVRLGYHQQIALLAVCAFLGIAWLSALEYAIQIHVPQFQISNLAGFPVTFLVVSGLFLCSISMLVMFVQDGFVAFRIAGAVFMPMLQVAALHYYVISEFKQCIPLPVLYILIPFVLGNYIWKRIITLALRGVPYNNTRTRPRESIDPPRRPNNYVNKQPVDDSGFEFENFNWNYREQPIFCASIGDCAEGYDHYDKFKT